MKKIYIVLVLACLISNTGIAQNYTISPSNTMDTTARCNFYSTLEIFVNNETTNKLSLSWELLDNTLSSCWDYSLCDLGHCFTSIPKNGTMDSVDVSGYGFFKLTLDPINYQKNSVVKLLLFETDNPSVKDTVTFIVDGCSSGVACSLETGISEKNAANAISVFPNPAMNTINIELSAEHTAGKIEIYNVIGKKVMDVPTVNKGGINTISLEKLSAGAYFIRYSNKDGITATKKFYKLSQQ